MKKFVRIVESGSVIPQEKSIYPALVVNCSPFGIYAAIIDYRKGKHYSVSVHYEEIPNKEEYINDLASAGKTLGKIAFQEKLLYLKLSTMIIHAEENIILEKIESSRIKILGRKGEKNEKAKRNNPVEGTRILAPL